jgi:hypothetical protein
MISVSFFNIEGFDKFRYQQIPDSNSFSSGSEVIPDSNSFSSGSEVIPDSNSFQIFSFWFISNKKEIHFLSLLLVSELVKPFYVETC